MKSQLKSTLACALCAGLLTLGAGKLRAVPVVNPVFSVSVQLTALTTTSRGKVQKTRITTKDLLNAIGDTAKGDKIVEFDGDFWIVDKHNNFQEDLSSEGIFEFDTTEFSSDEVPVRGGFKTSETGTVEVSFFSDGEEDAIDSDLTFDLEGTFSTTATQTVTFGHIQTKGSFTFSNLGNEGFDFDIDDSDVPMSGSISGSATGISGPP